MYIKFVESEVDIALLRPKLVVKVSEAKQELKQVSELALILRIQVVDLDLIDALKKAQNEWIDFLGVFSREGLFRSLEVVKDHIAHPLDDLILPNVGASEPKTPRQLLLHRGELQTCEWESGEARQDILTILEQSFDPWPHMQQVSGLFFYGELEDRTSIHEHVRLVCQKLHNIEEALATKQRILLQVLNCILFCN